MEDNRKMLDDVSISNLDDDPDLIFVDAYESALRTNTSAAEKLLNRIDNGDSEFVFLDEEVNNRAETTVEAEDMSEIAGVAEAYDAESADEGWTEYEPDAIDKEQLFDEESADNGWTEYASEPVEKEQPYVEEAFDSGRAEYAPVEKEQSYTVENADNRKPVQKAAWFDEPEFGGNSKKESAPVYDENFTNTVKAPVIKEMPLPSYEVKKEHSDEEYEIKREHTETYRPQAEETEEGRKVVMRLRGVVKDFQNGDTVSHVLRGVDLDVYEGEFLVILGASGCGKSTLLNVMGALKDIEGGTVEYMGTDITRSNNAQKTKFRRDNIGFVFQDYNLMPNLNAKQNLDLMAELVKNPKDSMETLKMVGLEEKAKSYPSQLSGGQQQRVSIARALVKNPGIILADEPTAALDHDTSVEVLAMMGEVVKNGTTLVMVTHNEEITKMADRVVRISRGVITEEHINEHPLSADQLVW